MKNEKIREKLANLRSVQTHTWTGMLVTISGTLSLVPHLNNWVNISLFIIGFIVFFALLYIYLGRNEIINTITDKMEDK